MAYLSIIIPVYNVENYLEACVDSILSQDFKDYEIILIDDGSTDKSGKICDAYAAQDERVRVFHIENGGPSKARNYALAIADGKYVEFVDSDDQIESDALIKIYEKIHSQNEEVLIMNTNIVDGNDSVIQILNIPNKGKKSTDNILIELTPTSKAIYLHYLWNKWYSLDFLRRNNITFDENVRLGEDFLFNCNVFKNATMIEGTDVLLYRYYKRDNGSLSSKFNADELQRRKMMDAVLIDLYQSKGLYCAETREQIDQMIGAMAFASIRAVFGKNSPKRKKQKEYVRDFLESEYYDYLIKYLSSGNVGMVNRVEVKLLEKRFVIAFLWLEELRKKLVQGLRNAAK